VGRSLALTLVIVATLVLPARLHAQIPLVSNADTLAWWHVAAELRPLVERGTASNQNILRLAQAELALGRPDHARDLLQGTRQAGALDTSGLALLATAAYAAGDYAAAGVAFADALPGFDGVERGVLAARAAEAWRLSGQDSLAVALYQAAQRDLPAVAGWLAVREATVTHDPARALALLRRAPPEAAREAARIRSQVLLAAADSAGAMLSLMQIENWGGVLPLALALDDTAHAREATYRILRSSDTTALALAVGTARGPLVPESEEEVFFLAYGLNRLGQPRDAAAVLEGAAAAGDTSAGLLRRLGDLQSGLGRTGEALHAYARAAASIDDEGGVAAYRRARLLLRSGKATAGYAALSAFAEERPEHQQAPQALYLVADWHRGQGRTQVGDSLFAAVAAGWPADPYASRARLALAQEALVANDAARAAEWYQAELDARGAQGAAAQYFLADLKAAAGDSAAAEELWADLAHKDAVGYYGTLAAFALSRSMRDLGPTPPLPASEDAARTLERIDLLYASFLTDDADLVIRRQLQRAEFPEGELVALAYGLIERGWVQEGVTLGWRAARWRTLEDPVVLRLVFPFPMRSLVERAATEQGLDPYLLAAVIRQESTFRPGVVSRAGAHGLMQLMPETAREVARRSGMSWDSRYLESADANLHLGAAHLASLLRQFDGRVAPALAAYNAGGRPVSRWLRYPEAVDPVRFVERIPYEETRGYVRAVLRNRELYRQLYPSAPPPAPAGEP
jgi:soluble lytic murein transglycosylase